MEEYKNNQYISTLNPRKALMTYIDVMREERYYTLAEDGYLKRSRDGHAPFDLNQFAEIHNHAVMARGKRHFYFWNMITTFIGYGFFIGVACYAPSYLVLWRV